MYDVIIAGAGPAGAMAGKYLAASGKRVLLLQKDLSFKKPCGGGLRIDAFDEFDLDRKTIQCIVNEVVFESKKSHITYDIFNSPLAIVDRMTFDRSLRRDAVNAGAELLEEKVINILTSETGVKVETEGRSGGNRYEADYLIAADGVLSFVRKQIRKEKVPAYLTHYSDIMSLKTTKCHFYFGTSVSKGAYGWRFPYGNGSDVGIAASENDKKYIDTLFDILGLKKDQKIRGYKIPVWQKPLFYDKRIFYVGDAAGQVLPFTYEGIYYAMKSAKILSEVIVEGCEPEAYKERWNRLYLKKFSILSRLEKLFLHHDLMVHVMMKTLERPEVRKKLLNLWMDQYDIRLNLRFFVTIFKNLFR